MKQSFALLTISGVLSSGISFASVSKPKDLIHCEATREYVTTVEYLRDKKDFGLQPDQIYKYADTISQGCSGASARFIKISQLLTKVGIDSNSAIGHAQKFSQKDDSFVDAFITIFKQTYDPKNLDLDALNALNISLKLSVEFSGVVKHAVQDFDQLVKFCKSQKEMDLPLPQCAELAARVTRLGQDYNSQIAPAFIELVKFLEESNKGPKRPKSDVLKIAESVVKHGPLSAKNFIDAYRYAVSKNGLNFNEMQAIEFGSKMASRSSKEVSQKN
jgi:hypothetical protein